MKTLILLLILFSVSAQADEWRSSDTYRETTYLTLHLIDWQQTRTIARNPDRYYEINPLIGTHPTIEKVDTVFLISAISHIGISYFLPSDYRHIFQYFTIGFKSSLVAHNYSIGLNLSF